MGLPRALGAGLACLALATPDFLRGTPPVDFAREVRPILSENCFACHGPDEKVRKGKLRLDVQGDALARGVIVPGRPDRSALIERIASDDPGSRMPPAKSGKRLTAEQIAVLRRWIDGGAPWAEHWAFVPPKRRAETRKRRAGESVGLFAIRPPLSASHWPRNEIDCFILARLKKEGLTPSPEAEPETLLRRLHLDLTGLPPSAAELDEFRLSALRFPLSAYERLVDRLLASPHYGEKMALDWLDLARFGDTNGYQDDAFRPSWPYRDHVIAAFNANQPFDQFTIEQLAGDLLRDAGDPRATLSQKVASGFNRQHRQNEEGGSDPDEFRVVYTVDRTNTVATTWLGLTLGCAQCHDHKYDPITQKEYYQLFAFFNSLAGEVPISNKNPSFIPPQIPVPTPEQETRLAELGAKLAAAERSLLDDEPRLTAAFAKWLETAGGDPAGARAEKGTAAQRGGAAGGIVARTRAKTYYADTHLAGRLTLADRVTARGKLHVVRGVNHNVNIGHFNAQRSTDGHFLGLEVAEGPRIFAYVGLRDGTRVASDSLPLRYGVEYGWSYTWDHAARRLRVEVRANSQAVGAPEVELSAGQAAGVVLDAFGIASRGFDPMDTPLELYVDDLAYTCGAGGSPATAHAGQLRRQTFDADPGWSAVGSREGGSSYGFEPGTSTAAPSGLSGRKVEQILALPASQRTEADRRALRRHYVEQVDSGRRRLQAAVTAARKEREEFEKTIPQTLVWEEMDPPRPAFVLKRGDFQQPGERVERGVPAVFPPLWRQGDDGVPLAPPAPPKSATGKASATRPPNRLDLARWLVRGDHPLTARVAVNRLWKQFFGAGLVRTMEDFGARGEPPTHPELLDWLAVQFMADGWDVKKLQRRIVLSATYRQSSRVPPRLLELDPQNRLLARGPRFRLAAEEVRDAALAVSGLLVRRLGGQSVYPYQPAGFYLDKSKDWSWPEVEGGDLYRRGLYTFIRRTTPYPMLTTFDSPARGECVVNRPRTNTPLQALVTLNDPVFVEAARVFGQRILREGGPTTDARLVFAFRTALARQPTPSELSILRQLYVSQLARYKSDAHSAAALASQGKYPRPPELNAAELAAWTAVGNALLNLDETIIRE